MCGNCLGRAERRGRRVSIGWGRQLRLSACWNRGWNFLEDGPHPSLSVRGSADINVSPNMYRSMCRFPCNVYSELPAAQFREWIKGRGFELQQSSSVARESQGQFVSLFCPCLLPLSTTSVKRRGVLLQSCGDHFTNISCISEYRGDQKTKNFFLTCLCSELISRNETQYSNLNSSSLGSQWLIPAGRVYLKSSQL